MAMRMIAAALAASVAAAGCSGAGPAGNEVAVTDAAANNSATAAPGDYACPALPASAMPPRVRGHRTMAGQPMAAAAPPPLEVVVQVVCLAHDSRIERHLHRWPRYGYIETGSLEVVFDDGSTLPFSAGDVLIESIDTPHRVVVGPDPVRMIVTDQIPYVTPPPDPLPENVVHLPPTPASPPA